MPAHLFVDISSHGFGHLATTAPVLADLRQRMPDVRLTVRSGLPLRLLQGRITGEFSHIDQASDFGFVQKDAVAIDHAASRRAYRDAHQNFPGRVAGEAEFLAQLKPDLVLSNVSYLPLAGACLAGIPSVACCSLNWFGLVRHYYGSEDWAHAVLDQMWQAYSAAEFFIALTPGMPMPELPRRRVVGPVATLVGAEERERVRSALGVASGERLALLAMGGFNLDITPDGWPVCDGLRYLVPESWGGSHPAALRYRTFDYSFGALLRAADVVVAKPGYGTFAEAACMGVPMLYVRRDDWPEQEFLIDWFAQNGCCAEVTMAELSSGTWVGALDRLFALSVPDIPQPVGAAEAARLLVDCLEH